MIGVYDSGLGGLTVLRELLRRLPYTDFLYLGDTARAPYGDRPASEIISFSQQILRFMVAQQAQMVVAACNTSSALALPVVRRQFPVPVLGVIEPGADAAAQWVAQSKVPPQELSVGVIATVATVRNGAYLRALQSRLAPQVRIIQQACPALVPLIEAGHLDTPDLWAAAQECLAPLARSGVRVVILGCTHYPLILPVLRALMPPDTVFVDPAQQTAEQAARLVGEAPAEAGRPVPPEPGPRPGRGRRKIRFYTSGDPEEFQAAASRILGWDLPPAGQWNPEDEISFVAGENEGGVQPWLRPAWEEQA